MIDGDLATPPAHSTGKRFRSRQARNSASLPRTLADGSLGLKQPWSAVKSRILHRNGTPDAGSPDVLSDDGCDPEDVRTPICGHRQPYISLVVEELIDTEKAYVKDLRDVVHGYMRLIGPNAEFKIRKKDFRVLFGNIRSIYRFNKHFLGCLEESRSDAVKVAQCFVNEFDKFVIYAEYCTNYPRSVEMFERLTKDECIGVLMNRQQKTLGHCLPLSAYLFKPVQRILKYHLLLQNILHSHDENDPGHESVVTALDCMMDVAKHLNELKRQHERLVRTHELRSSLDSGANSDVVGFGELVLEDNLRLVGSWSDRHVLLFHRAILLTKKLRDGSLQTKACLNMSNLALVETFTREPLHFVISPFDNQKVQYTLQARNIEQKRRWCQEIKKLIIENFHKSIPDRAKEVVLGRDSDNEKGRLRTDTLIAATAAKKLHRHDDHTGVKVPRRKSIGAPSYAWSDSSPDATVANNQEAGVAERLSTCTESPGDDTVTSDLRDTRGRSAAQPRLSFGRNRCRSHSADNVCVTVNAPRTNRIGSEEVGSPTLGGDNDMKNVLHLAEHDSDCWNSESSTEDDDSSNMSGSDYDVLSDSCPHDNVNDNSQTVVMTDKLRQLASSTHTVKKTSRGANHAQLSPAAAHAAGAEVTDPPGTGVQVTNQPSPGVEVIGPPGTGVEITNPPGTGVEVIDQHGTSVWVIDPPGTGVQSPGTGVDVIDPSGTSVDVTELPGTGLEVMDLPRIVVEEIDPPDTGVEVIDPVVEITDTSTTSVEVIYLPVTDEEIISLPATGEEVISPSGTDVEVTETPATTVEVISPPGTGLKVKDLPGTEVVDSPGSDVEVKDPSVTGVEVVDPTGTGVAQEENKRLPEDAHAENSVENISSENVKTTTSDRAALSNPGTPDGEKSAPELGPLTNPSEGQDGTHIRGTVKSVYHPVLVKNTDGVDGVERRSKVTAITASDHKRVSSISLATVPTNYVKQRALACERLVSTNTAPTKSGRRLARADSTGSGGRKSRASSGSLGSSVGDMQDVSVTVVNDDEFASAFYTNTELETKETEDPDMISESRDTVVGMGGLWPGREPNYVIRLAREYSCRIKEMNASASAHPRDRFLTSKQNSRHNTLDKDSLDLASSSTQSEFPPTRKYRVSSARSPAAAEFKDSSRLGRWNSNLSRAKSVEELATFPRTNVRETIRKWKERASSSNVITARQQSRVLSPVSETFRRLSWIEEGGPQQSLNTESPQPLSPQQPSSLVQENICTLSGSGALR